MTEQLSFLYPNKQVNNYPKKETEKVRGVINNRDRNKQIKDFSGLIWRKITPTDIDGLLDIEVDEMNKGVAGIIEFGNEYKWVIIELKYKDNEMPMGQRICFERLCDTLQKTRETLFILARHEIDDPDDDIPVAKCIVEKVRYRNTYHKIATQKTVKEVIDKFLYGNVLEFVT